MACLTSADGYYIYLGSEHITELSYIADGDGARRGSLLEIAQQLVQRPRASHALPHIRKQHKGQQQQQQQQQKNKTRSQRQEQQQEKQAKHESGHGGVKRVNGADERGTSTQQMFYPHVLPMVVRRTELEAGSPGRGCRWAARGGTGTHRSTPAGPLCPPCRTLTTGRPAPG